METVNTKYLNRHKKFRTDSKKLALVFFVLAALVAFVIFWWLKLVGITISGDAFCGLAEHTHSDACYTSELLCEMAESTDESAPHTHTEACYQNALTCDKVEHVHTPECFPNPSADVETVSDWLATIEDVAITNDVPANLVAIAKSQVGYTESRLNFEYDDAGNRNGYTRYGEWYGTPYSKWDATFVSFCLHYSNINNVDALKSAGAESMRLAWQNVSLYTSAADYVPQRGDVVFVDTNSDGGADTVAIILSPGTENLVIISGDVDNQVAITTIDIDDHILGYGMTGKLSYAKNMNVSSEEPTTQEPAIKAPLMMFSTGRANITYTSDLTNELANVVLKTLDGEILDEDSIVYIGVPYQIILQFREINTGTNWIQFDHTKILTYQIPDNLHCDPFTEWLPIMYKNEDGTEEEVGHYFIDENGLLQVEFYDDGDESTESFLDKYSNVAFNINFHATLDPPQSGDSTDIEFNDKIDVNLNVDRGGILNTTKTYGEYNFEDNTIEYTIRVESVNSTFNDLTIRDDTYHQNQIIQVDSIQVTDLNGNLLDPQPTYTKHVTLDKSDGFLLSDFPEINAGEGFIVTYKTKLVDEVLNMDQVTVGNFVHTEGTDDTGTTKADWEEVNFEVEPERINKTGKQTALLENGERIPVIEWQVEVRKHNFNLHGTVVVDTLGEGLAYYTGKPIEIQRWDENGQKIEPNVIIDWNDVNIVNNSIDLELPDGYQFLITYYTTYDQLANGETTQFHNQVHAVINGQDTSSDGNANVVGFVPYTEKTARGDDGEYVYFTITTNMPAHIKNEGNFYFTDYMDLYGNQTGYYYMENKPQDMVITAVTESGQTITFTPYVPDGPEENTYILQAPLITDTGEDHHYFNIYFNTSEPTIESSKWLLDELSTLTVTYKIPFSAKTVDQQSGAATGNQTLGELLAKDAVLNNHIDIAYTKVTWTNDDAIYTFNPKINKQSQANRDGTIDYTVNFTNRVPNTAATELYLNPNTQSAYFTDTFDERLEYVPGSLSVTCYNPWSPYEWLRTFTYQGVVEGNTIYASTDQFTLTDTNPDATLWMGDTPTLPDFYAVDWLGCGLYEFTYTLKIKDEYLNTTDQNLLELINTAEIIWDEDGTTGSVTNKTQFETGLVDKQMARADDHLDFSIYINRNCLDVLPGADTLTVTDVMSENLATYWESIHLYYEDGPNNWVSFHSEESRYQCTVNYNQITNTLTFVIPDELHVKIDYTTLITEVGMVSVHNTVSVNGKSNVSDFTEAIFKLDSYGGDATGSLNNITLIKHDGITHKTMSNVTLYLYGRVSDMDIPLPDGMPRTITDDNGEILYYIGAYTTGEDGTVNITSKFLSAGGPYAVTEGIPPPGYLPLEKPVYFYYYEPDPDGIVQTVTTIVAVHNFSYGFVLPETGGTGTLPFGIIGIALMAAPIVYSIIRRKRERRLT